MTEILKSITCAKAFSATQILFMPSSRKETVHNEGGDEIKKDIVKKKEKKYTGDCAALSVVPLFNHTKY